MNLYWVEFKCLFMALCSWSLNHVAFFDKGFSSLGFFKIETFVPCFCIVACFLIYVGMVLRLQGQFLLLESRTIFVWRLINCTSMMNLYDTQFHCWNLGKYFILFSNQLFLTLHLHFYTGIFCINYFSRVWGCILCFLYFSLSLLFSPLQGIGSSKGKWWRMLSDEAVLQSSSPHFSPSCSVGRLQPCWCSWFAENSNLCGTCLCP